MNKKKSLSTPKKIILDDSGIFKRSGEIFMYLRFVQLLRESQIKKKNVKDP